MNIEELAFVNRQLAGMLKSGIPLEAGLKKITESMSDSKLKAQLDEWNDEEGGFTWQHGIDWYEHPQGRFRFTGTHSAHRAGGWP